MPTVCPHLSRPVTPRECVVHILEIQDASAIPTCRACALGQALLETAPTAMFASLRATQRARSPLPERARPNQPGPEAVRSSGPGPATEQDTDAALARRVARAFHITPKQAARIVAQAFEGPAPEIKPWAQYLPEPVQQALPVEVKPKAQASHDADPVQYRAFHVPGAKPKARPEPDRDPRLDILAGVLAYALPRYSKQPRLGVRFLRLLMAEQGQEIEVEDLAELCRRAGLDLATVKRAPYVLINPRAWALAKEAA